MEKDWKKIRSMVPFLRERYLAEQNRGIIRLMCDPEKNETERFWDAKKKMREVAQNLRDCLDGHSRSNMWIFMNYMYTVGMLKEEDLAEFSEEAHYQIIGIREELKKQQESGSKAR